MPKCQEDVLHLLKPCHSQRSTQHAELSVYRCLVWVNQPNCSRRIGGTLSYGCIEEPQARTDTCL